MHTKTVVVTRDGKKCDGEAEAIKYLKCTIETQIGRVVDQLMSAGVIAKASQRDQVYNILNQNLLKFYMAYNCQTELEVGLVNEEDEL